ncbi:MAG TPA: hypothetical protein VF950_04560 [Planctomycetota bacterium]
MDDRGRHHDADADDVGAAGEMLHRLLDDVKSYARSRPLESLMGAFLLGLLVALLGRKDR